MGHSTEPKWLTTRFLILVTAVLACIQVEAKSVALQAQEAVQTIQELRAIGLPNFEAGESGPPARVPGLLKKLNGQLRTLITDTLNDQNRSGVVSEREITAELQAAGWKEIPPYKWNAYGEIRQIQFELETGYDPGILVVSTQLWVPCGDTDPDTAIYVFQGYERNWKMVLATDADFDTAGNTAQNGMEYKLSPPDGNGNWYLAIAQAPPACGSTPAPVSLQYRILRAGRSPDEPRILLERRESLNERFEPPFRLEVQDDWVAVTRGKERNLDGEPGVAISRYQVIGDKTTRMQPLALTPEDFLDEWVKLNWSEAAHSSSESSDLPKWHSILNALANNSTEFEFVQPCHDQRAADKKWLAGLWIDQKLNSSSEYERLYVVVSERQHAFFVDSVQTTRPPGCPGKLRPLLTSWKLPQW
jgi:hypothetical protein